MCMDDITRGSWLAIQHNTFSYAKLCRMSTASVGCLPSVCYENFKNSTCDKNFSHLECTNAVNVLLILNDLKNGID